MFRKIKKILLVAACVFAMTGMLQMEASAEGLLTGISWSDKGAANVSDFLNIRKGPSADSEIVAVLLPGRTVTITGSEGSWSKVSSAGYSGYVMTKYLVTGDSARQLYISKSGATGSVTASSLILREAPSTDSAKLTSVPQGTAISLKSLSDGWYKVSCAGVSGYMLGSYVKESQPKGAISKEAYEKLQTKSATTTTSTESKQESSSSSKDKGYVISCSDAELDMLAAIVQCEAGGESDQGKLAVAAVVVNRVQSKNYPNSVEKVIKQKGQFSPVASGRFASRLKKGASKSCYTAAKRALSGEDNVSGALHFRAGHSKKGIQVDNQYFY